MINFACYTYNIFLANLVPRRRLIPKVPKMCKPCASKARAAAAASAAAQSSSTTPSASASKVQMSSSSIATPKAKAFRDVGRPRVISNGIRKR